MIAPTTIDELQEHPGEVGAGRFGFAMNYGLDRVRLTVPLPVGGRVRLRASLDSVAPRPDGADVATTVTFERAGGDRPGCVARLLIRVRS